MTHSLFPADLRVHLLCPNAAVPLKEEWTGLGYTAFKEAATTADLLGGLSAGGKAVAIVEYAETFDLAEALQQLAAFNPNIPVLVLGDNLPALAVRELAKFKYWDIVGSNISIEAFNDLVIKAAKAQPRQTPANSNTPVKKSSCWAFVSSVGGAGASLIAVEAAYQLTLRTPKPKVCLIDLNFVDGSVASYINCDANFSAGARMRDAAGVDSVFLSNITTNHELGFDVVAAPAWEAKSAEPSAKLVLQVLETACAEYDMIILDVPRWPAPWQMDVFAGCDAVMLISELTVPALNATRSWAQRHLVGENGHEVKIRPILNRQQKGFFGAKVTMAQAEAALGQPIYGFVRSDWQPAMAALNLGRPVGHVKPNSPIAKDVSKLIDQLLIDEQADASLAA